MNAINPTINYHLVTGEQARHRAHAARMRMLAGAPARVSQPQVLGVRRRVALATAAVVLALTAAAATAVATSGPGGAGSSPVAPNDCAIVGPC